MDDKFIRPISYGEAAHYIFDMKNHKVFRDMDGQISGILDARKIKLWVSKNENNGILFWYCYDKDQKLFRLAVERKEEDFQDDQNISSRLDPNDPLRDVIGLRIVQDVIKKNYQETDRLDQILTDIENEPSFKARDFLRRDSRYVRTVKDEFNKKFNSGASHEIKLPIAYFSTKFGNPSSYFKLFFDQADIQYIRYYIGYSSHQDFDGQNLRLILAPCNKEGKSLTIKDCSKKHLDLFGQPILLQNSWPPKPRS